jgi:hypothetical protein
MQLRIHHCQKYAAVSCTLALPSSSSSCYPLLHCRSIGRVAEHKNISTGCCVTLSAMRVHMRNNLLLKLRLLATTCRYKLSLAAAGYLWRCCHAACCWPVWRLPCAQVCQQAAISVHTTQGAAGALQPGAHACQGALVAVEQVVMGG